MAGCLDLKFWTPRNRWKRFFVAPISETCTSVPYYSFQKVTLNWLEMFGPIMRGMSLKLTMSRLFQGSEILRHLHVCVCVCLFLRSGKRREANMMCIVLLLKENSAGWRPVLCQNGFLFGLCHFPVQNQILCFRLETTCFFCVDPHMTNTNTTAEAHHQNLLSVKSLATMSLGTNMDFRVTWQVPKCFPNLIRAHNMSFDVWFYV